MFRNVHITGIGSYNPKRVVDNEYYIEHFKKYGLERQVEEVMDKIGRKTRHIATDDETSITMSLEAARMAIEGANIKPEDIDGIISASDTPEYLSPCCALILKNQLKAKNAQKVFDINNDCIGMLTAMDIATRYLKTDKKYKRILVIGSMLPSRIAREDCLILYACFADGAAAVVLEVKEEDEERGLLGSRMYTDDSYNETVRFPACGLSKITNKNTSVDDKKIKWNPFDFSFLSDKWTELIINLLLECGYTTENVKHYFMSQFSKEDVDLTLRKLGAEIDQATFVGDKYGYTGPASPVMALNERIREEKFDRNDITVFCSVGGGYTMAALLYKW